MRSLVVGRVGLCWVARGMRLGLEIGLSLSLFIRQIGVPDSCATLGPWRNRESSFNHHNFPFIKSRAPPFVCDLAFARFLSPRDDDALLPQVNLR